MLLAHLVPAYFATEYSQARWPPEWNKTRREALWIAAFVSTVVPDLDVVYNVLFRGFFGHTILWTHSLLPYLGMVLMWWCIRRTGRWPYIQTLIGLVTLGGLSHLLLDVVAHSTPLFYPFSMYMVGAPSEHVRDGGLWGYLTDPIFLLEPFLLALTATHWVVHRRGFTPRMKRMALLGVASGFVVFSMVFLLLLPTLQRIVVTSRAEFRDNLSARPLQGGTVAPGSVLSTPIHKFGKVLPPHSQLRPPEKKNLRARRPGLRKTFTKLTLERGAGVPARRLPA